MKWTENTPVFGDMIRVKVKFYYHYGIFADEKNIIQFGMPDNGDTPPDEIAVISTDISTFAGTEFVECAQPERDEKKMRYSPEETVRRASARLGEKGYHILSNNCEHFAYECYLGEKRSFLDDVRAKIRKQLTSD